MAEERLTLATLACFHREIVLPDMEHIVDTKASAMELRIKTRVERLAAKVRAREGRLGAWFVPPGG